MMFESFLQNYIKNFEEQENIAAVMENKKKARVFKSWKGLVCPVKTSQKAVNSKASVELPDKLNDSRKHVVDSKVTESNAFCMDESMENEYMILVNEFRKVNIL